METPTRDSTTAINKLVVNWVPPINDGYSAVQSYNLQWDKGTDGLQWINLIGFDNENLALTYTVTSYIVPGGIYKLKVRAKNYWGWGEFSDVLTIKSATWPNNMVALTTSIEAASGNIKVQWVKPYDNE
jgi:heterodisulfide reductase subunit A-like polyferredoxin